LNFAPRTTTWVPGASDVMIAPEVLGDALHRSEPPPVLVTVP
jgi:hypothetical protein